MDIFIRADEGCAAQPILLWDTVWNSETFSGDWALAGPNAPGNSGGLQATAALATAVILALWSDKRCPPSHPLAKFVDPKDLRGWWGDGVDVRADLGETELGSLLWMLERMPLTSDMPRWAESMAQDALACLVTQGAVALVDASASILPLRNGIALAVALYGQNGEKVFDRKFEAIWQQVGK